MPASRRCCWRGRLAAQAPEPLSIVVFSPPSLGAFLPPVIKAQKLDEKHGLAIKFEERTPDAYTAQFNSGEFKLGGSASLMTVGLADIRGVKVTYLFNLFDFWGAVVTVAARDQDAEGSRRQGRRRRQGHHQLGDVRLVRPPARRRHLANSGGQHRDARPDRLRAGRPRHGGAALGAGLYDADDEEAGDADHRPRDCRQLEEIRRQHATFPISASPRISPGRRRTRSWSRNSSPPTRRLRYGSTANPDEAAKVILAARARPTTTRRSPNSSAPMTGSA